MIMNVDIYETQSNFLKAISHSNRLAILDILRDGEQCVCHLEAVLNLRQAYISQQLMVLKQAELVDSRRDGLNLYYRVIKPEVFAIIDTLNLAMGIKKKTLNHANTDCPCPKCSEAVVKPQLIQI
ncbi:MAG: ArsR/SmtB family transcription factor [Anaerolineales bacterium]